MCIDSLSLVPLFPPSLVYLYIKINYDFIIYNFLFMTLIFITLFFITLIFMALLFITLIYIFMQQQFGGTDFYTVCYEITDS